MDSLLSLAKIDPFKLSDKSHEAGGPWDVTSPYDVIDDKNIQTFFMVDMDENDINNPANCFVEELKEANPNNISVPICGAKILEDNEKIAQDLSNRDKSADIF